MGHFRLSALRKCLRTHTVPAKSRDWLQAKESARNRLALQKRWWQAHTNASSDTATQHVLHLKTSSSGAPACCMATRALSRWFVFYFLRAAHSWHLMRRRR